MPTMRNDHEYTKRRDALKRIAKKKNLPCHLCGQPINYQAHYTDRLAFTADHQTAVAAGGHMTGPLLPAHRACNSRRGATPLEDFFANKTNPPTTATQW